MKLSFKDIDDDKKWDELVLQLKEYSFLNSSARYRFNESVNDKSFRYAIFDSDKFIGVITGSIGQSKLFGHFLDCKHSPLLSSYSEKYMDEVTDFVKKLATDNDCFMIRFAPLTEEDTSLLNFYQKRGFVKAPIHNVDALISQKMDLTKSMDELRRDMRRSRRKNLNKLLKDTSIEIKIFTNREAFDVFKDFHLETVKLKGYIDKPVDLLMKELDIQVEHNMCYMVVAYSEGIPISIWQCTVFGKNMHLYQACSSTEYREKNMVMTAILYWKTIELGKNLGCTVFDMFGGVVPRGYEGRNHPWEGVGDFKKSLGGEKMTYMHSRDLPILKLKYWIYYIYSYIRTRLKGYTVNW